MLGVHHRCHRGVEVGHLPDGGPQVPVGVDVGHVGPGHHGQGGVRVGLDQADGADRPGDPAVRDGGEHHVERLGRRLAGADGLEGLGHRVGLRQAQEVGAHQAAGRLGVVGQQRADLPLLRLGQQAEDGQAPLLVELGDEVGGVVGGHRPEDLGGLGVGAVLDELDLVPGVELLEHVRLELAVLADRLDDLLALLVGGGLHQVGDLGRVEPGQLPVGDAEVGGGHMGHERLDVGPVHHGAGPDVAAQAPGEQAADQGSPRRVDPHHLPGPVDEGQLDLVGLDQAAADEVDQVPGLQVLGEQQLARTPLEPTQVHPFPLEADPTGLEGRHLPHGHEEVAPGDGGHHAGQRGVGLLAGPDDQVLHPPQPVTVGVHQRPADDARQMEDRNRPLLLDVRARRHTRPP